MNMIILILNLYARSLYKDFAHLTNFQKEGISSISDKSLSP